MKPVYAVSPFKRAKGNNFKMFPFYAWEKIGGKIAKSKYPSKILHSCAYKIDFPTIYRSSSDVRLRFVEVNSLYFDAFPDYVNHEIIPIIWDCWPKFDKKLIKWLNRHNVKACVLTSSQAARRIQTAIPTLHILIITEGICIERYGAGKELKERSIDLYSYGRLKEELYNIEINGINIQRGGPGNVLFERLQDAKITVSLPQCDVLPKRTGGQETLTQRFWECMLSRTVLLGRAPKELIDLIGYDPVVHIDYAHYQEQVKDVATHISDYQDLVDKNRETALRLAPWEIKMAQVMDWLETLGYQCK